jgi:hypothetical protein
MPIMRGEDYVRTNNTDANFRAWAQFIHDVFALGWVQTADTGQIDLTTVTVPTTANDKQGYEIWRMDDDLQADYPVYVRIDYGSAGAAGTPGIWLAVGTGSDGAGNLTGVLMSAAGEMGSANALISSFSSGTNADNVMLGSADTDRIAVALFFDNLFSSGSGGPCFGIERLKDEGGLNVSTGLNVTWSTTTGLIDRSKVVYFSAPSPPRMDNYFAFVTGIGLTVSSWTTEVGVGVIYPMEGGLALPFIHNWCAVNPGDWRPEAEFDLFGERCGADVRFRKLGGQAVSPFLGAQANLCIRWD